ncbi:hypothetical protein SNE40_002934 [Patella caerulea]|uniref:Uncharacterized protein n=1 Tax=Patella caerulea TaxID=87958 RepID=A0AAN8QEM6_PATCE
MARVSDGEESSSSCLSSTSISNHFRAPLSGPCRMIENKTNDGEKRGQQTRSEPPIDTGETIQETRTANSSIPLTLSKEKKKKSSKTKSRLDQMESKLDRLFDLMVNKNNATDVNNTVISPGLSETRSDKVTESKDSKSKKRDVISRRSKGNDYFYHDSDSDSDCLSILPGQDERIDSSEPEEDMPVLTLEQGINVNVDKSTKGPGLFSIFGTDATTRKDTVNEPGIRLDQSQRDVINHSWRCSTPSNLTAFSEENIELFPTSSFNGYKYSAIYSTSIRYTYAGSCVSG